jgi:hypothetical protein
MDKALLAELNDGVAEGAERHVGRASGYVWQDLWQE